MGHNASDGSEGSEAKEGSDNMARLSMLINGNTAGILEHKNGNAGVYSCTAMYQKESVIYRPGNIFSF